MDSVQEILNEAWDWDYGSPPSLTGDQQDRIRRAALVEAIRGCRLEWDEGDGANEFVSETAIDPTGGYYWISGDGYWYHSSSPKHTQGGKDGAQRDYWRRLAEAFEGQFPGITDEVCCEGETDG